MRIDQNSFNLNDAHDMPNSHQKKILLVEDEKMLCFAFSQMIPKKRFILLKASNGEDGLATALRELPDLILLDLMMPVMDGKTMLGLLRADPWGKDVPVIILTNLLPTTETILIDIVTHKPMRYLIKSELTAQDLLNEIEKIFC